MGILDKMKEYVNKFLNDIKEKTNDSWVRQALQCRI